MNTFKDDDNTEEKLARDLLETAGRRPSVPENDVTAIKNAARTVWQAWYAARVSRFRRPRLLLPLAAAVLGGLVLTWWIVGRGRPGDLPVSVAHVDRVSGTVIASNPAAGNGGQALILTAGHPLAEGVVVESGGDSRVALRLIGRHSLRLDVGTRVHLVSSAIVQLDRGAVYLDSFSGSADGVIIRTTSGDFRPVGTQFEVRVEAAGGTHLRVREGQVRLERKSGYVTASAGEELIVDDDGTVTRGRARPYDPSWDWILESAPMLDIEGRTLRAFLDWVAREKGWKVHYAGNEAASLSETIVLHGSIEYLALPEALRTVTLSTGFEYRVSDGTLIVSTAASDRSVD